MARRVTEQAVRLRVQKLVDKDFWLMRQINSISLEISDLQGVYRTLREPTEKMRILNKIDNLDREKKMYLETVRELRMDLHVKLHYDEPGGVSRDMSRWQKIVREAEENVKSVTKEIIDYQKMHGANSRSDFNFDKHKIINSVFSAVGGDVPIVFCVRNKRRRLYLCPTKGSGIVHFNTLLMIGWIASNS